MKVRLMKQGGRYVLYAEGGHKVACTSDSPYKKLSLKNCQAIELGYDLGELSKNESELLKESASNNEKIYFQIGFVAGFQKCLEILGDKKFSGIDLDKAIEYGHESRMPFNEDWYNEFIQSLQQTEWEVEIVMEEVAIGDKYTPEPKPKLDSDGCLILKRK